MAPLAALIARLKAAKLIVQTHGIEAWPRPSRLQREALESADLLLCVSRYTRGVVLSWAAIEPERVLVVPNTFKTMFAPGESSQTRAVLGMENKRILLTVARMDASQQYKGQDRVISAIPYVLAQGHDVQYFVVGEGDDRTRLESLASKMGVSDRVHFFGAVKLQDLTNLYRAADLFVMPSTGEGFGIAFLEAMTSGTPVLGLDIAGARDALADGELGTIVSEHELPAAIVRLLAKPKPDPVALAAAACTRFGREKFAACVRGAFNRLIETN
jgi:phosphatidylinositol alpha-1,6-mannosyltransferase